MAKLRKSTDAATSGNLPPSLARFTFEDWHDAADADGIVPQPGSDPDEVRAMTLVLRARCRWREARSGWAEAHGVDWRSLPSPHGLVVDRVE